MGAQPKPTTTTAPRKRKAASRTSSSDSIQITKVRKTGRPAFSPSPSDDPIIIPPPQKVTKTYLSRKPKAAAQPFSPSPSSDDPVVIPPPQKVTKTYLSRKPKAAAKPFSPSSDDPVVIPPPQKVTKTYLSRKPKAAGKPSSLPPPPKATPSKATSAPTEKRPKRFRPSPPKSVQDRLHRALSQRLIVLSRSGASPSPPSETFTIAGSTGNIYTIRICAVPTCDCPDGDNGRNTCKHILYILSKVLKARADLVYQAGLLTSELEEIFAHAPAAETGKRGVRKPLDGDDCPICFSPFEGGEETTWCKAMCGTNVHKECFAEWRKRARGPVTCVMCRTPWQEAGTGTEEVVVLKGKGRAGRDGYVNVAGELGISTVRDMSTYSEWFTGRRGYGYGGYR